MRDEPMSKESIKKIPLDSVHYFVRGLFRGIPETTQIAEQREELETHINDRITDSVAAGNSYEESFNKVIAALGNLNELIETITGKKKKILINKANWFLMVGCIIYGTLYMTAVGIWFALVSFGWAAVYIAIPGWLGFVLPTVGKLAAYCRNPGAVAPVSTNLNKEIRSAFTGWFVISLVCWAVNFYFAGSHFFLNVIWAWMPTCGVLTWPLMVAGYAWMIRNLKSLDAGTAEE